MSSPPVVNVLVDGFAHLGPLSYLVPDGLHVRSGDAVEVPFGKRTAHGVVLGPGNPANATKPLSLVFGPRVHVNDIQAAREVASEQLTALQVFGQRFAPRKGKGAAPVSPGQLQLSKTPTVEYNTAAVPGNRMLLLHPPLVDPAELAAAEAQRLSQRGQVLILCPTTRMVERVLNQFTSGAVRLDAKAPKGSWQAFRDGTAPVGVGARGAAWYSAAQLGGIIVVDEHNEAHREQTAPRHHSRVVASARAQAHGAALTLTSATPSPAGMGLDLQVLPVRAKEAWPRMTLHDITNDYARSPHIPYPVIGMIKAAAKHGRPLVVLTGRCVQRCTDCFEERPDAPLGSNCPVCGSTRTRLFGYDEARIKDILGDGVIPVQAHELDTHRNAGLVVIPELEASLRRPSLIPYQYTNELIMAAAAAAGPNGQVVGVTHGQPHPVVDLLFRKKDQMGMARGSYAAAQRLQLPPFGRLAVVQFLRKQPPTLSGWPGHVHGPVEIEGGWEVLVRCEDKDLKALQREIDKLRKARVKIRYYVD